MKKITALLHECGDWHRRNDEYTGFSPVNIHYRIWREGHVSRGFGKDRILCPDQPKHLRMVDMAVAKLPKRQKDCVRMKFFAPLNEDGHPYTHREMSQVLEISKYSFERNISRAKKAISAHLRHKVLT